MPKNQIPASRGQAPAFQEIKVKLAGLKRSRKFYDWRGVPDLADKLILILDDISRAELTSEDRILLVKEFYCCDKTVFNNCDDSSGQIGDIFRYSAKDLFWMTASRILDKSFVFSVISGLLQENQYSARDTLLDDVKDFLSVDEIRILIDLLRKAYEQNPAKKNEYSDFLHGMRTLAGQIPDPELYVKICKKISPDLTLFDILRISEVYLNSGQAEKALEWIGTFTIERDYLLKEYLYLLFSIYKKLGLQVEALDTAWRMFHNKPDMDNFELIVGEAGESERGRLISELKDEFLRSPEFSYDRARFLIDCGGVEEAGEYIIGRRSELDGKHYRILLDFTKMLEKHSLFLPVCAIYRTLLESILARTISKYYPYAVRYLRKLDNISPRVSDWRDIIPHTEYLKELSEKHCLKVKFWSLYSGE
jgi:tetratricopeptide (TPR) repeat protein